MRDIAEFSLNHMTYINQIFGDQTVREAIADELPRHELYPEFQFKVEYHRDEFEEGTHHVVDLGDGEIWCSVDSQPFQDVEINSNDTLCQSYTLLKAFGELEGYVPDAGNREQHREIQFLMIRFYRRIIAQTWFKELLLDLKIQIWKDFKDNTPFIETEAEVRRIIKNIALVLDDWEEFGFLYFTGAEK